MIPLVVVLAVVALAWLGHRTVQVSRRGDETSAALETHHVFTVGEGKHARFVAQTPEGDRYEQVTPGGIWEQTATTQEQAVATLNEEAAA